MRLDEMRGHFIPTVEVRPVDVMRVTQVIALVKADHLAQVVEIETRIDRIFVLNNA